MPNMQTGGELQALEALQRRRLAFVFAEFTTFNKYSKYLSTLFSHLSKEAPAGYHKCQLSQIVHADKLVFSKIIEEGFSFSRDSEGNHELDDKLMSALMSYDVSFALLPKIAVQKPPKPTRPGPYDDKHGDNPSKFEKGHKGKGKGKKGKSKNSNSGPGPKQLVELGCVGVDDKNRRICFNYNLTGCTTRSA